MRARVRAAADSRKIAGSIAGRSLWFRICAISAHVRDSLWFFSALVVLAHAVLALVLIGLSDSVPDRLLEDYPRLLGADADSSRILLSTIAGSIVTVAGVTFSITVLVMAQAAYQYTPRILRNFLRDRQSQIVLGVLIGVFVYCLVVMHAIRTEPDLVPSLAVLAGVVLALFAVGALVFFLHHISTNLDVGTIIARLCRETLESIDHLYPIRLTDARDPDRPEHERPSFGEGQWQRVDACVRGYLQSVDAAALAEVAEECDAVIRIEREIGDFVAEGSLLLSVSGSELDDELANLLRSFFTVDAYRTVYQDVAFGIRQIVDIAVKALSPAMNDPTTATICIDHLAAVLIRLGERKLARVWPHAKHRGRLLTAEPAFADFMDAAFDEIRRSAASCASVLARVLLALEWIADSTSSEARLQAVAVHIGRVLEAARSAIPLEQDRIQVQVAFERARAAVRASLARRTGDVLR